MGSPQRLKRLGPLVEQVHTLLRGIEVAESLRIRLTDREEDCAVAAQDLTEGRKALFGLLVAELRELVVTVRLQRSIPAVAEHRRPEVVPKERVERRDCKRVSLV